MKDDSGVKAAHSNFVSAASIFAGLADYVSANFSSSPSPDFANDLLKPLEQVMAAQAVEALLARVIRQAKATGSPGLAAKVAQQCSNDYDAAMPAVKAHPLLSKQWLALVTAKKHFYRGEANFWQSEIDMKADKYGTQVAWLYVAEDEFRKATAGLPEAAERLKVIQSKCSTAVKDNQKVYRELVPKRESLPPIPVPTNAIVNVKSTLPNYMELPSCGPELFSTVASIELSNALTDYRQQRSELTDELVKRLRASTQTTVEKLGEWNLPAAIEISLNPDALPQTLLDAVSGVRDSGGMAKITAEMDELPALRLKVLTALDSATKLLDNEECDDATNRKTHGDRWTPKPSAELNTETRAKGDKYRAVLKNAEASDQTVAHGFEDVKPALATLLKSPAEISETLPAAIDRTASGSDIALNELRERIVELDRLREERDKIERDIGTCTDSDDPNSMLSQVDGDYATAFQQRLTSRYGEFSTAVNTVVERTSQVLNTTEIANGNFCSSRAGNANQAREDAISQLLTGYEKFKETLANVQEGANFYKKLGGLADDYLKNCTTFLRNATSRKSVNFE